MALTLRTDPELDAALTALASAEGASRQEVIRRAVLDRYERNVHDGRVGEAATRMIARWADVLDRLGSA
jgi:predicted transcriptional regulator